MPFPFPGDLPDPRIEPRSPELQADTLTSEPPGKPSVTLALAKISNQLHCILGIEISPRVLASEEDALNQALEQTESSSRFILVKDLDQGTQNPVTDRPEAREHVCPEAAGPLLGLEPSTSHPSPSPSFLAPLIFPAADIDQILCAGYLLQEVLGALLSDGGNADFALLVCCQRVL